MPPHSDGRDHELLIPAPCSSMPPTSTPTTTSARFRQPRHEEEVPPTPTTPIVRHDHVVSDHLCACLHALQICVKERRRKFRFHLSPSTQSASSICLLRWRAFFSSTPCILHMGYVSIGDSLTWCNLVELDCRTTKEKARYLHIYKATDSTKMYI